MHDYKYVVIQCGCSFLPVIISQKLTMFLCVFVHHYLPISLQIPSTCGDDGVTIVDLALYSGHVSNEDDLTPEAYSSLEVQQDGGTP